MAGLEKFCERGISGCALVHDRVYVEFSFSLLQSHP